MLKQPIILPIALLLFLALLSFWINQTVQEQGSRLSSQGRHDPDYMLYNFVSTRTDASGFTKYVLAASQMRHYPDSDTTDLQRPRFTQFGLNKPYTQIHGQRGKISANGKQVEFTQHVKVTRQATATKGEMQLVTDQLTLLPDQEIAHTDRPVVIKQQPATVITATGMTFDNKSSTIQLFNRVHVHYERALEPGKSAPPGNISANRTSAKPR